MGDVLPATTRIIHTPTAAGESFNQLSTYTPRAYEMWHGVVRVARHE